jgi:hypothetical protein
MTSGDLEPVGLEWKDGIRQMNKCEYLFVDRIGELKELTLELVVSEGKPQAEVLVARNESVIEQLRIGGKPIERDVTCRVFHLVFDRRHMVSYSVLNESYGGYPEPPEQFTGKLFRIFSWSHLLEFIKSTTCASDEFPGVLQHYQVACLNYVVDVICTAPPRITIDWPSRADNSSVNYQ